MSILNRLGKMAQSPRMRFALQLLLWIGIAFCIVLLAVQVLTQPWVLKWLDIANQSRLTDGVRLLVECLIFLFWPRLLNVDHLDGIKAHLKVRLPVIMLIAVVEFAVRVMS